MCANIKTLSSPYVYVLARFEARDHNASIMLRMDGAALVAATSAANILGQMRGKRASKEGPSWSEPENEPGSTHSPESFQMPDTNIPEKTLAYTAGTSPRTRLGHQLSLGTVQWLKTQIFSDQTLALFLVTCVVRKYGTERKSSEFRIPQGALTHLRSVTVLW